MRIAEGRRRRHRRPAHAAPLTSGPAGPLVRPLVLTLAGLAVLAVLLAIVGRLGPGGPLESSHDDQSHDDQRSVTRLGSPETASIDAAGHGRETPKAVVPRAARSPVYRRRHARVTGAGGPAAARAHTPAASWRHVLNVFDDIRAQAWLTSDPALLRAIYTPGSPALSLDRGLMADYRSRGLRVRGVHLLFGRVRVMAHTPGMCRLRVVDRLGSMTAATPDGALRALPHDQATRHQLVLRRIGERWRIARITAV